MNLREYFVLKGRGSAKDLAKKLVKSPSYLSQIASGIRRASPTLAVDIEEATNKLVSRKDLRPNDWKGVWPEIN